MDNMSSNTKLSCEPPRDYKHKESSCEEEEKCEDSAYQDNSLTLLDKYWSSQTLVYNPLKSGSIDGTDTLPHDRAVSRAICAEYKPNKNIHSKPENTIFVAKLHKNVTQDTLLKAFSEFGTIKSCSLIKDIITGDSKGYAFIEYENERSAARAYRNGHNILLGNQKILVDYECERLLPGWIPRRLGGGFGGRKNSGQLRFGSRDRPYRKPIDLLYKRRIFS